MGPAQSLPVPECHALTQGPLWHCLWVTLLPFCCGPGIPWPWEPLSTSPPHVTFLCHHSAATGQCPQCMVSEAAWGPWCVCPVSAPQGRGLEIQTSSSLLHHVGHLSTLHFLLCHCPCREHLLTTTESTELRTACTPVQAPAFWVPRDTEHGFPGVPVL